MSLFFRVMCLVMLAGGVGLATGCGEGAAPGGDGETGRLTITGSSTIAPLASEMAKRYEQRHPGVRIDVQTGGSSRGVADALQGLAEIGMVSRTLKDEESQLDAVKIALDGVAVIVHADNPVGELSPEQIVEIYTGKINDWSEIEGAGEGPITVVNKAEGRSTLELFLHHFGLENSQIQADVVIGDNQQGIKQVAGDPRAIGYVSIGTAESSAEAGVTIRALPLEGVPATIASVRSGAFPLSRPLNLVTFGPRGGLAEAFLEFASSGEVNDIIEGLYFVPIAD